MSIVVILLMLTVCTLAFVKNKNFYNPTFMLSAFWSLILILASMHLYDIIVPSSKVYLATLLGLLSFAAGCACFSNNRIIINGLYNKTSSYAFCSHRFNAAVIAMLAYELYRFVDVFRMLRRGYSLNMIRLLYFGANVDGFQIGRFESVMETYAHLPLLYACMALLAIDTMLPKKEKMILLPFRVLGYIWIGLAQVIMGGRMVIYIFAVELVFAYIITNKIKLSMSGWKKKILIVLLVAMAIGFIYWLSISRTGNKQYPFLRSLYVDFCGCFAHMTIRFESIDFEYTYGLSLLSGILRPLMLLVKYTIGSFPSLYQVTIDIGEQLQGAVMIGPGIDFNAYVLPVFYFYYDCGFLGIIVDSFICGAFCQTLYKNLRSSMSPISKALYMIVVFSIFTSMIRYAGNLVYIVLSFAVIRLMFRKQYAIKAREKVTL